MYHHPAIIKTKMALSITQNDITYTLHINNNELHIDALYIPECFTWTTVINEPVLCANDKIKLSVNEMFEVFNKRPSNVDIQFDTFKNCETNLTITIKFSLENILSDETCIILYSVMRADNVRNLEKIMHGQEVINSKLDKQDVKLNQMQSIIDRLSELLEKKELVDMQTRDSRFKMFVEDELKRYHKNGDMVLVPRNISYQMSI